MEKLINKLLGFMLLLAFVVGVSEISIDSPNGFWTLITAIIIFPIGVGLAFNFNIIGKIKSSLGDKGFAAFILLLICGVAVYYYMNKSALERKSIEARRNSEARNNMPSARTSNPYMLYDMPYQLPSYPDMNERKQVCSACYGRGYRTCAICHGSGMEHNHQPIQWGGIKPSTASPPLYVKCTMCDGTGKTVCFQCAGTGYDW